TCGRSSRRTSGSRSSAGSSATSRAATHEPLPLPDTDLTGELAGDGVLGSSDRDSERAAERLRTAHRHPPARNEGELGEVAQEGRVAVGNPLDGCLLARGESIERAQLRAVDLQARVRDRVTVGVVRRIAELLVDPRLELF